MSHGTEVLHRLPSNARWQGLKFSPTMSAYEYMTIKHAGRSTTFNAVEQARCVKKRRALQKAYMVHLMRMILAKLRDYFRELFSGIARL